MSSETLKTSSLPSDDYQWVRTKDGSLSLFSRQYNENCHSLTGAKLETQTHYIKACEIEHKLNSQAGELAILEVGFGTGLGFLETYKLFKRANCEDRLQFISLEIDPRLVEFFRSRHPKFKQLKVLVGNARKTIEKIDKKVVAIYQDAFSPRRNPELWTSQWFEQLAQISHTQTILSTYSASTRMRKSMVEAGWKLSPGRALGPKRSATIAKRSGQTDSSILDKLERSPVEALRDCDIENYRKII